MSLLVFALTLTQTRWCFLSLSHQPLNPWPQCQECIRKVVPSGAVDLCTVFCCAKSHGQSLVSLICLCWWSGLFSSEVKGCSRKKIIGLFPLLFLCSLLFFLNFLKGRWSFLSSILLARLSTLMADNPSD